MPKSAADFAARVAGLGLALPRLAANTPAVKTSSLSPAQREIYVLLKGLVADTLSAEQCRDFLRMRFEGETAAAAQLIVGHALGRHRELESIFSRRKLVTYSVVPGLQSGGGEFNPAFLGRNLQGHPLWKWPPLATVSGDAVAKAIEEVGGQLVRTWLAKPLSAEELEALAVVVLLVVYARWPPVVAWVGGLPRQGVGALLVRLLKQCGGSGKSLVGPEGRHPLTPKPSP